MRTGLVLGAGGVVGASWLIGALDALANETGWDPTTAEHIVGTSAGSVIGGLTAAGVPPHLMGAYVGGGSLDEVAEAEERADLLTDTVEATSYRLQLALPPIGPGSWRMALATALRPHRHSPAAVLSGWLPRGVVSTRAIEDLVDRFVPGGWPDHPSFWAVAADYGNGRRVAFGRDDAPPARAAKAIAASCAIPGFYHPVKVGGRRYVDGGICSMSNVDLLCDRGLDLVICLNPTSSLDAGPGRSPLAMLGGAMRNASGRRLGHEVRKLRAAGTEVVVLQPTEGDLAVMGANLMARGNRGEVVERAMATTSRALRDRRGELRGLCSGTVRPATGTGARQAA